MVARVPPKDEAGVQFPLAAPISPGDPTVCANYERPAAIKAKYDPINLFRLDQNMKPRA